MIKNCEWPGCIIAADHTDPHMDDEGNQFTDEDALERSHADLAAPAVQGEGDAIVDAVRKWNTLTNGRPRYRELDQIVNAADWVDPDEGDTEVFCDRCAAGVDSDEHHTKCVITGHAIDGEPAHQQRGRQMMRSWKEIIDEIVHDEKVTEAEADVIYRKRIAAAHGEVYTPNDNSNMLPETNRAARRANKKRGLR